jgi:hypothetical protein
MIINPFILNSTNIACAPVTGNSKIIGVGSTSQFQYPAYGLYNYSWTAQIYLNSDFSATPYQPYQITGLEFSVQSYTTPYTFLNQTIKLGHLAPTTTAFTTAPNVSLSNYPVTDLKVVKTFNWTINSNSTQTFLFDSPFCYNGTSNLVLVWENRDGAWTSGYGSVNTTLLTGKGAYANNDPSFPTGTASVYNYRMNMKFTY